MNDHDVQFTPESVDEQVEQLLSSSGKQENVVTPQARMVRDLQATYDEEEILTNVWSNLIEHIEDKSSQQDIQNEQSEQQIANLNYRSATLFHRAGPSRLSLIAAVLLTAVVVGSMVWTLTRARPQQGGIASSTQQDSSSSEFSVGAENNAAPSGVYIGAGNGVLRIDKQTHKVLWQYKLPAPSLNSCGVKGICALFAGDLILAQNTLYVPSQDGTIYALDANSGALRWSHNFKMNLNQTILVDDTLYSIVSIGRSNGGADYSVYALNAGTGRETKHYHFLQSTTDLVSLAVARQTLYACSDNSLFAWKLTNGSQIWHQQIDQKQAFYGLQIVNDTVYTSSVLNPAQAANYTAKASTGYVYAFNAKTGTPLWHTRTAGNALVTAVAENVVYLSADQYMLYAYDARTGKALWHRSVGTYISHLVANAGTVYIGGSYGENTPYQGVIALNAKDGSVKWKTPDSSTSTNEIKPASGPVLADGVLYVGDLTLHALNAQNGSAIWSLAVHDLDVPPVIDTIIVTP